MRAETLDFIQVDYALDSREAATTILPLAADRGMAVMYIVSHPAVTCCVPGTAKVEYLLDNLGAAEGRLPDAATRRRMEELIDRL